MRRRLWVALAVLVAVGLPATIWGASRALAALRLRAELDQAESDLRANLIPAAHERLVQLEKERPGEGEVEYHLGLCEEARGRSNAAMRAWARVRPGSPFAAAAAAKHATMLTNLGHYSLAEAVLESVRNEPPLYEVDQALARLLRFEGRLDEVRRLIRTSWGRTLQPAAALKDIWTHDKAHFPVEAWEGLGLNKADQNDDRVWLGHANVAILTGRIDDATRLLDACQKKRPNDPAIWRTRLDLAKLGEDPEGVRTALEHLSTEKFSDLEILNLRIWLAAQRGDRDAEQRLLSVLVERYPGNTRSWERLANLAAEAGEREKAERLHRRKAELDDVQDRFRYLAFLGDNLFDHAEEFARLAQILGRRAEYQGWSLLHARGSDKGPTGLALPEDEDGEVAPNAPTKLGVVALTDLLKDLHAGTIALGPAQAAKSKGAVPYFVDDTKTAGLSGFVFDNGQTPLRQIPETISGGVALFDYDGDGWLDVYVVQGGPLAAPTTAAIGDRLFRNNRDGTFTDVTEPSRVATFQGGFGMGVTTGDYDNDGDPDLFVTRLQSYALYRNKGDGTFEDVTRAAGLAGPRDCPTSSAFVDLDDDGDLDLYVCHYMIYDAAHPRLCPHDKGGYFYCDPSKVDPALDHVYRNDGGRFADVTTEAGFVDPGGRGLGVVAVDVDNDHKIDLYVANDGTGNYLFHNLGGFKFEEIGHLAGVTGNADGGYQAGMGVACPDLDGDGLPELMVTNNYGESTTLYQNLGRGIFTDLSASSGLALATRYRLGFAIAPLDFNNDGRADVMEANGNVNDIRPLFPYAMAAQLFAGDGKGRLIDVSERGGPPWQELHVGRGLAIGDIDNDGRVDALLLSQNEPMTYFHNRTEGGRSLALRLIGTKSNRDAIGAKITVKAGGHTQFLQRFGGGSYQSAGDLRLHVGLGDAASAQSIDVRWPSGKTDTYHDLAAGTGYVLREGDPTPKPMIGFDKKK